MLILFVVYGSKEMIFCGDTFVVPPLVVAVMILSLSNAATTVKVGDACSDGNAFSCSKGCYVPFNTSLCIAVGAGYFSPAYDISRYPCRAGTYSDTSTASACFKCPPGSFSPRTGSTTCSFCPSGYYSQTSGSKECFPCNTTFYDGVGSDYGYFFDADNNVNNGNDNIVLPYCLEPAYPIVFPTGQPTKPHSESPTLIPTSAAPTTNPPALRPSTMPSFHAKETTPNPSPQPTLEYYILPATISPSSKPTIIPGVPITKDSTRTPIDERARVIRRYLPLLAAGVLFGMIAIVWQRATTKQDDIDSDKKGRQHRRRGRRPPPPPPPPPPFPLPSAALSNQEESDDESFVKVKDDYDSDRDIVDVF